MDRKLLSRIPCFTGKFPCSLLFKVSCFDKCTFVQHLNSNIACRISRQWLFAPIFVLPSYGFGMVPNYTLVQDRSFDCIITLVNIYCFGNGSYGAPLIPDSVTKHHTWMALCLWRHTCSIYSSIIGSLTMEKKKLGTSINATLRY